MRHPSRLLNKQFISLLSVAFLLSILVGTASFYVMRVYRLVQPIWVEQAAYSQMPMVEFAYQIQNVGISSALLQNLGQRHLLQLFLLGIFAPSLLSWFYAPLLVVIPFLFTFLVIFGWTVYKRTGHIGYSICGILMFLSIAELTRHNWGIGSGFADWQSMLLLSSAALCLINALIAFELSWIRAFAVFVSFSVLARTTAVFYAVVICAPMLLLILIHQFKKERSWGIILKVFVNIVIILAPVAIVIFPQLEGMFLYYSPSHASQLSQPFLVSFNNILFRLLFPFLGTSFILVFVFLFLLHMLIGKSNREIINWRNGLFLLGLGFFFMSFTVMAFDIWESPENSSYYFLLLGVELFIGALVLNNSKVTRWLSAQSMPVWSVSDLAIGWWFAGFLGFLLMNGYTSNVPKEVMYIVPTLVLGAMTPFINVNKDSLYKSLSVGLVFIFLVVFFWNIHVNIKYANKITPEQVAFRNVEYEMATVVSSLPPEATWQSFVSVDWGIPVSLLSQYESGEYHRSGVVDFYNKKDYWDTWYPGLSLDELQSEIYNQASNCADAVVVLRDPEIMPTDMEEYSYKIAAYMAIQVQNGENWKFLSKINGWPVGTRYAVYLNEIHNTDRNCQK